MATLHKDEKLQVVSLILFSFALRVVFLHWNKGEYTDGILQINLFTSASKNTFFMPLYTLLTSGINFLVHDLETSAKLISMIAGVLGILPVYYIARRMYGNRAGLYAAILYSVSPEIWRWHLRVMTDSLFCTLFLWSVYHIFVLISYQKDIETSEPDDLFSHLTFAWLAGGLATLTRYQGLALFPLLLLATSCFFKQFITAIQSKKQIGLLSLSWLLVFLIWFGIPTWWMVRGMGHVGQYSERMSASWQSTLSAYLIMAESFIVFLPSVITYPIFLFTLYGYYKSLSQNRTIKIYYGIFFYIFILWLLAHAPFQSFQFRYFIPIISLALIPAAYGMTCFDLVLSQGFWTPYRRRWVCFLAITFSLGYSGVSIFLQQDTFGDIKDCALFMKEHLAGQRIWDNEQYREGVTNVKIQYWSGLPVQYYNPIELQAGDYVCLHNVQGDINYELARLNEEFDMSIVYRTHAETLPLLPDIMVNPPVTSRPEALIYKYFPQQFLSVIVKLEKRKQSPPIPLSH